MDEERRRLRLQAGARLDVRLAGILVSLCATASMTAAQNVPASTSPVAAPANSTTPATPRLLSARPLLERLPPVGRSAPPGFGVKPVTWEAPASSPEPIPAPGEAILPDFGTGDPNENQFPLDLPSTLRLAGANNLQIAMAYQKVLASQARLQGATALWLPSLEGGMGYNQHSGRIQDTFGEVIDVNRSSAFVGGGPNLGDAPLNGGTNGPPRLFLGLPLADAVFARLAERQRVRAAGAHQAATFNDTLLAASVGYFELLRSQVQVAIAREAVANAGELARLVEVRVRAGTTPPADELRARAELADRERRVFQRWEGVRDASADLVRVLNLEGGTNLFVVESQPMMIDLVDLERPLPELIAQGLAARPEMAQHRAQLAATLERLRQERWRPVVPSLQVGFSGGGFGGGRDGFFGDFGSRGDFDALAVWELRNLGFGNAALIRERGSEHQQARLSVGEVRNSVAAEIVRSYYQARLRKEQVEAARRQLEAAAEALPLNFKGILGGELRAIEGLQAVDALTAAQIQYLESIVDYDRAQFALLRALGNPPDPQADVQFTKQGTAP